MKVARSLMLLAALAAFAPAQVRTGMPAPGSPAPPVTAIPTVIAPPSSNLGMIGLISGQALRIVATNVGIPPAVATAPVPACGLDVKFFDADGNQVGSGGHIDSLASGKSFAVELPGPTASGRAEYRTQLQIVTPSPTSSSGGILAYLMVCNIVYTAQVYEASGGKTDFVLTGTPMVLGFIPGPPCLKGEACPLY